MAPLCKYILYVCFILNTLSQPFVDEIITGPSSPLDWSSWINSITEKRTKDVELINYNGSIYKVVDIQWTQSSFIQPQMHGYDAYFYDIKTHSFTFDKWLNDLNDRYGGIDSFLFWVTYTNLGADDRNQFDMNYAVPGGIEELKKMVQYMHNQDPPIKVLFPYNPWDQGTHDSGLPDYQMMAKFLNETGADGFNGDTMGSIPEDFYTYSLDTYNHPIALEPEGGGTLPSMNYATMGWGYWYPQYNNQPLVGKWKWFDGRHLTNVCNRWAQDHTDDLQNAYFNGVGFESWENVWGCWNGIVPRDAEALRRIGTILRYFGNRNGNINAQNFTQSRDWLPFIPIIEDNKYWKDLFASSFTVDKGSTKQQILFLIVNRNSMDIKNTIISFNNTFTINVENLHIYDCYYGKQLNFTNANDKINVFIDVEGLGYGALLVTMDTRTSNKDLDSYLSEMNVMTQKPLNSFSSKWNYLLQNMTQIEKTKLYSSPPDANMITIPTGIFDFKNDGVEIEGDDKEGVDVQYPWEMHPQKEHSQKMTINKFYIDKYPVTCSEYSKYLTASKYKPSDSYNYLKNWKYDNKTDTYTFPTGYDNKPVTYLSLNEVRLFCDYNGKRLPHSYEWQYAAQGNTSYLYPWGNQQNMGTNFPETQHGRSIPGPADVDAFIPQGNSIFGVSDIIGNVWQMTDEFTDPHTRSVVVMGSSNYRPIPGQNQAKTNWYFPPAYQLNQHNKYFLMDDSYERCGTIGFRCAADATQSIQDNNKIYNWNGKGNYCTNLNIGNGVLCGMINAQDGYNDLTKYGTLDWIKLGSKCKLNRKQTSTQYIGSIECPTSVAVYNNNINSFYWSDGDNDIKSVLIHEAVTDGIYFSDSSIKFSINNLKQGVIYRLRVYVGVYKNRGNLNVKLKVGLNDYLFMDNTVHNKNGMSNVVYDLVINLETITTTQDIQLWIEWIDTKQSDGNISLHAVALSFACSDEIKLFMHIHEDRS